MLQYRQGGAAGGWYVSVLLNFIVIWMIAHPQPPNPPTPQPPQQSYFARSIAFRSIFVGSRWREQGGSLHSINDGGIRTAGSREGRRPPLLLMGAVAVVLISRFLVHFQGHR